MIASKTSPTLQSSKAGNQIQKEEEALSVDKLQRQFLILQQDWETLKKYNPRTRNSHETSQESIVSCLRSSLSSTSCDGKHSNFMLKTLNLVDQSSPRYLISSLQSDDISDSHIERPRLSIMLADSEARAIVRGRREAIKTGSLKGRRRLFEGFGDNQETHDVRSVVSFDESAGENDESLGPGEIDDASAACVQEHSCTSERVEQSDEILKEIEKTTGIGSMYDNKGLNLWFAVVVVFCALLAICFLGSFAVFNIRETNVILVPT